MEPPEATTPTILQVRLLGSPAVQWAGAPLSITRRQVRALLFRLAAAPDPVSREQLCFLFWPDDPETDARRKLTGLLTHLRRTLPDPAAVLTFDDRIGLDPQWASSELTAFKKLCASRPTDARPEALRRAVDLYGGPFLDGFSLPENPEYENWVTVQRQTCERLYREALATLIDGAIERRDYGAAIGYAQRYLEVDDLAEEVHRRLIELYAASGERSAALRQYELAEAILERELGVEPLPETRAAYRAALASQPLSLPAQTPGPIPSPPSEPQPLAEPAQWAAPAWTTLPGLDAPLVGRHEALLQLKGAYAQARKGQGRFVLISGEPGVGKSRLVQEFATGLGSDALVLVAAGYRDSQATPFQPLVDALRAPLISNYARLGVPDPYLAEAARLMPELRLLIPEMPPAAPSELARARLFEALARITVALANGHHTLVLCLDDLHWADATTLEWLAFLGRHLRGAPLLVLGTYGTEEAGALVELRRGLERQGVLLELELAGLDEEAVQLLLQSLPDALPAGLELARPLQQLTAGNPFYLLETLRALLEAGCRPEDLVSPPDLCLPDSVGQAIEARVARLSPMVRQALEAGAVLGRSFSLGLIQRTSGRGEMEMVEALDELVARRLLDEGSTGYWFSHDLIRAAVYRQLSIGRRRLLHRRAAAAIRRLQPYDVVTLGWHYERADEPGSAARYALQAGRAAKEIFAHAEARVQFERALRLLEWEAVDLEETEALAANRRLRMEALYERGWALRLVGDMETYSRDLAEVAHLAGQLGDASAMAHLHWRQAYTHRWFCRFPRAREAAEEGVRLSAEAGDPRLEAMCWREVGLAARATGDYERARAALDKALALFGRLADTVHEIHTLGNLATLCWYEAKYEEALNLSRTALVRCDEAGLVLERRLPLGDMGAAALGLGSLDLARQCLDESLSIALQTADRTQEILSRVHLGWLELRLAQPSRAREHLQAGLALAQQIGSCVEQGWLLSGLAEAYRLQGDCEQALAHARQALKLARASGAAYDRKLARRILRRLGEAD